MPPCHLFFCVSTAGRRILASASLAFCNSAALPEILAGAGIQIFTAVYCSFQANCLWEQKFKDVEEDSRHALVRVCQHKKDQWRVCVCVSVLQSNGLNSDPDYCMLGL